ncbi:MAG: MBOAT family protein [Bacilli bacterium]|nr:MBOAT family protein [Bacilli bacterium]
MVFSSIPFIFFFLPVFLILYYLVPYKVKNILLLIFSLIFYAWGEPIYILLMIFSSVVDYTNGRMIEKYAQNNQKRKNLFLIISIIVNLSLLGFFKYADFLIGSINSLLNINIPLLELGLPIGISFFTFQTMSYSIDVYRGDVKAEHNFLDFMTYVSMFPQLIAGPIVRYEEVSKELKNRSITPQGFADGMIRFLQGLFKKVLIANNIGYLFVIASSMPNNEMSVVMSWLGILAYTFQIYFDFSGYSDMAIGMGKMLGFTYPENFNHPYISKSITEFWRRWHISLSSFFKDYVYIPLGGSRVNKIINVRNILIVWMLTGLWHGASWNFVLWGLYYGVLLLLEKFVFNKILEKAPNWFKHFYTMFLVVVGWMIFAFDDMTILKEYASMMFGVGGVSFINNHALYYLKNYLIIFILAIIFSMPVYKLAKEKLSKVKNTKLVFIVSLIIYTVLFIVVVSYLVNDTYNPFLYFRF